MLEEDPTEPSDLILASSSPQRRRLLAEAGYRFRVIVPDLPEPDAVFHKLPPRQQAEALAYFKAREVFDKHPDAIVLGADTLVVLGKRILGKPADRLQAETMLRSISGALQCVITGIALLHPSGRRLIASEVTWIIMRPMSEEEIQQYLASGEWIGKAGAYAIQETADRFVERIEGSFTNVVGLPTELLRRMIRQIHGRPIKEGDHDVAEAP